MTGLCRLDHLLQNDRIRSWRRRLSAVDSTQQSASVASEIRLAQPHAQHLRLNVSAQERAGQLAIAGHKISAIRPKGDRNRDQDS